MVKEVLQSTSSFEVDPVRISAEEDLHKNLSHLYNTCQAFLDAILNSHTKAPLYFPSVIQPEHYGSLILVFVALFCDSFLRELCQFLQQEVMEKFPANLYKV